MITVEEFKYSRRKKRRHVPAKSRERENFQEEREKNPCLKGIEFARYEDQPHKHRLGRIVQVGEPRQHDSLGVCEPPHAEARGVPAPPPCGSRPRKCLLAHGLKQGVCASISSTYQEVNKEVFFLLCPALFAETYTLDSENATVLFWREELYETRHDTIESISPIRPEFILGEVEKSQRKFAQKNSTKNERIW